jgi:hypothetical protein
MIERVVGDGALVSLMFIALGGFALGAIVGAVAGEGARALMRGVESAVLALLGGMLARGFASVLLALANDSPGAGLMVGWAFLIWPGAIDTIGWLAGERWLTTPGALLGIAGTVGALVGMMDGLWRVHSWKGLGWLAFPLDMTWGLAGVTNGALLHITNFAWGKHSTETRKGAHRYTSGFRLKRAFAFTQGSVMSNLTAGAGDPLFDHELTHVWQNRIFGPFFVLSYVGWMLVWVVPGMIAGAIVGAGSFQGAEKWCYFNNPCEVWGYAVQKQSRVAFGATPQETRLIWRAVFVVLWAIPFFGAALVLAVLLVSNVW